MKFGTAAIEPVVTRIAHATRDYRVRRYADAIRAAEDLLAFPPMQCRSCRECPAFCRCVEQYQDHRSTVAPGEEASLRRRLGRLRAVAAATATREGPRHPRRIGRLMLLCATAVVALLAGCQPEGPDCSRWYDHGVCCSPDKVGPDACFLAPDECFPECGD
jgi:hypothetical protein